MAGKEVAVKKYVVRLDAEERDRTQRVDSQRQAFRPVADEGLASQCLDRRIADKQILAHEVTAWQDHRNKHHAKADWQFTTANARVKLKRLYPQLE